MEIKGYWSNGNWAYMGWIDGEYQKFDSYEEYLEEVRDKEE